ncbi:TetR family transcriptional regulator [Mangrovimonas yunxiaonensis]|uniref:TetR family transcriptional regulator n=1 Tax=Mangrovimonas yunxiaonensis TaxID=1197477 RepID=A0A084TKZ7_9FLAO|nr:TetR/AcrR family transcriptional regulator [Mangrovimonas yunxiaonensis]KFB01383.1 TetR family transcriptional regulator [Mangrovimonas yunxiaonensis]
MTSKRDVLECSVSNFTKFGSKRFTMDELASELGISKKTIYKYFDSKEALVIASVQYLIDDYNQTLEAMLRGQDDPIARIIIMYEKAFERLKYFKPSFIFGLRKYYPTANKVFDDFRDDFVRVRVYNLLKEAQESGILMAGVNLNLFCDLYFKRFEEIAFTNNNLFDIYPSNTLLNHTIIYSLRGITKPSYVFPLAE